MKLKIQITYIFILVIALIMSLLLFTRCSDSISTYGTVNDEGELIIKGSQIDYIELDYAEDEIELHMTDGQEYEFKIKSSDTIKTKTTKTNSIFGTKKPTSTSKPITTSKPISTKKSIITSKTKR